MDLFNRKGKDVEQIVRMVCKLRPEQFLGVCKVLGVELYRQERNEKVDPAPNAENLNADQTNVPSARPAEELISEVIDKIEQLNRVRRKNLKKLLKEATKGE